MNKFCTNCGHPLKPTDKVCGNCGQPVSKKMLNLNSSPEAKQVIQKSAPKKKLTKGKKIAWIVGSIVIVLLVAGVVGGSKYYSQESQASRIVRYLTSNSPRLKKYVTTDNSSVKISAETLKPLQTSFQYYSKDDKKDFEKYLVSSLKNPTSKATYQLVRNGSYFLIFPKYSLKVRTYSPTINTDDDNDKIYINGTYMGKVKSGKKKLVNLLPGQYNLTIEDEKKENTYRTVDIYNSDPIFIDIKTYSVKIKGPAYSKIYFNGVHKKNDTLDKNGEKVETFYTGEDTSSSDSSNSHQYDPNEDGELYLTTKVDGKTVKSVPIKGFINQLSEFNTYGANSDDGVIKWSSNDDKDFDYIVTPKWNTNVSE